MKKLKIDLLGREIREIYNQLDENYPSLDPDTRKNLASKIYALLEWVEQPFIEITVEKDQLISIDKLYIPVLDETYLLQKRPTFTIEQLKSNYQTIVLALKDI